MLLDCGCQNDPKLMKQGFCKSKTDPYLFVYIEQEIRLLVYINNLVTIALRSSDLDWFYIQLSSYFNTKDLGEIRKILRVQITQNQEKSTIELNQEQYLEKILNKFSFLNIVQSKLIPMNRYYNLRPLTKGNY